MEFCQEFAVLHSAFLLLEKQNVAAGKCGTKLDACTDIKPLIHAIKEVVTGLHWCNTEREKKEWKLKIVAVLVKVLLEEEYVTDIQHKDEKKEEEKEEDEEGEDYFLSVTDPLPRFTRDFFFKVLQQCNLVSEFVKVLVMFPENAGQAVLCDLLTHLSDGHDNRNMATIVEITELMASHSTFATFPVAPSDFFSSHQRALPLACLEFILIEALSKSLKGKFANLKEDAKHFRRAIIAILLIMVKSVQNVRCFSPQDAENKSDKIATKSFMPVSDESIQATFRNVFIRNDLDHKICQNILRVSTVPVWAEERTPSPPLAKPQNFEKTAPTVSLLISILNDWTAERNWSSILISEAVMEIDAYFQHHLSASIEKRPTLDIYFLLQDAKDYVQLVCDSSHEGKTKNQLETFVSRLSQILAEVRKSGNRHVDEIDITLKFQLRYASVVVKKRRPGYKDCVSWLTSCSNIELLLDPSWEEAILDSRDLLTSSADIKSLIFILDRLAQKGHSSNIITALRKVILEAFKRLPISVQNDLHKAIHGSLAASPEFVFGVDETFHCKIVSVFNRQAHSGADKNKFLVEVSVLCLQSPSQTLQRAVAEAFHNKGLVALTAKVLQSLPSVCGLAASDSPDNCSLLTHTLHKVLLQEELSRNEEQNVMQFLQSLLLANQDGSRVDLEGRNVDLKPVLSVGEFTKVSVLPYMGVTNITPTSAIFDLTLALQLLTVSIETVLDYQQKVLADQNGRLSGNLEMKTALNNLTSLIDKQEESIYHHEILSWSRLCPPLPIMHCLWELLAECNDLWDRSDVNKLGIREKVLSLMEKLAEVVHIMGNTIPGKAFTWLYNSLKQLSWTSLLQASPLFSTTTQRDAYTQVLPDVLQDWCDFTNEPDVNLCKVDSCRNGLVALLLWCRVSDSALKTAVRSLDSRKAAQHGNGYQQLLMALVQVLPHSCGMEWCRMLSMVHHMVGNGSIMVQYKANLLMNLPFIQIHEVKQELCISQVLLDVVDLLCHSSCETWTTTLLLVHVARCYTAQMKQLLTSLEGKEMQIRSFAISQLFIHVCQVMSALPGPAAKQVFVIALEIETCHHSNLDTTVAMEKENKFTASKNDGEVNHKSTMSYGGLNLGDTSNVAMATVAEQQVPNSSSVTADNEENDGNSTNTSLNHNAADELFIREMLAQISEERKMMWKATQLVCHVENMAALQEKLQT